MTSYQNVALYEATWVINALDLFRYAIHGCLYNQALVDVRSNGAGMNVCTVCIVINIEQMHSFILVTYW